MMKSARAVVPLILSLGSFVPAAFADAQSYGAGCPAANGAIPTLRVDGPLVGGVGFALEVSTEAPLAVGLLSVGFSDQFAGATPLPLDLTPGGVPGCSLWVSGEYAIPITTGADGSVSFSVNPLPVGLELYAQFFAATAPGTPGSTIGSSRALALTFDAPPTPFVVAMLPDTQHYSDSGANAIHFEAQTQWIVDNKQAQAIAFTTLVGDIVENGGEGPDMNLTEWERADAALSTLDGDLVAEPDGVLPWVAVCGNHDYDVVYQKGSAVRYREYFGPDRFAGRSWFVGASANEVNMAQLFEVGTRRYLSLGLEWHPSDAAIRWAQEVLSDYAGVPTMISTHEHIRSGTQAKYADAGEMLNGGGSNAGESVFRKLVEPFPQVFLVLCGHVIGDGRRESTTVWGGVVHEVLADYQQDPNGGNGWMQLLRFDPIAGQVAFDTFSPTYVPGVTAGVDRNSAPASNFTLDFDLAAHRAELAQRTERRFREDQALGGEVYTGTRTTYVGSGANGATLPDATYGSEDTLRVDGNQDQEQALIAFDDIVGDGLGQVPAGTRIERAVLTVTTEGSNAASAEGASLHRMTVPWNENSTWDSLGGGVQLGVEAVAIPDLDTGPAVSGNGTRSFDVTAGVQAWLDGAPNHGWVWIANGTDRWEFRSPHWDAIVERPMLSIVY